jgi:hypothetical protein
VIDWIYSSLCAIICYFSFNWLSNYSLIFYLCYFRAKISALRFCLSWLRLLITVSCYWRTLYICNSHFVVILFNNISEFYNANFSLDSIRSDKTLFFWFSFVIISLKVFYFCTRASIIYAIYLSFVVSYVFMSYLFTSNY